MKMNALKMSTANGLEKRLSVTTLQDGLQSMVFPALSSLEDIVHQVKSKRNSTSSLPPNSTIQLKTAANAVSKSMKSFLNQLLQSPTQLLLTINVLTIKRMTVTGELRSTVLLLEMTSYLATPRMENIANKDAVKVMKRSRLPYHQAKSKDSRQPSKWDKDPISSILLRPSIR